MSDLGVIIGGHRFVIGDELAFPGPLSDAPTEALHILVAVSTSILDDPDRPEWVDVEVTTCTVREALDEIALRGLGLLPVSGGAV